MRKSSYSLGFLDLLFILNMGLAFLVIIAFMMINITKIDADIKKPKAEFLITLTWEYEAKHDFDIWVQDPLENLIYFRQKEKGVMHLDRDDRGMIKDVITLPNGEIIEVKENQEIVSIRGFIVGEWIINVHLFNKEGPEPIKITVKIEKLNPVVKIIFVREMIFNDHWEEQTVCRFYMQQSGEILKINYLPKALIKDNYSSTYNNASRSRGIR